MLRCMLPIGIKICALLKQIQLHEYRFGVVYCLARRLHFAHMAPMIDCVKKRMMQNCRMNGQ